MSSSNTERDDFSQLREDISLCVDRVFDTVELDDCWRINDTIGVYLQRESPFNVEVLRGNVTLDKQLLNNNQRANHHYLLVDGEVVDFASDVFDVAILEYPIKSAYTVNPTVWEKQLFDCLQSI